jgi:transcriptional regulator with XRE-family HTH domain
MESAETANAADFAQQLRELRERKGLTREELAAAVRASASTVKAIELGQRQPSPALRAVLLRVLDVAPAREDGGSVLNCWIAPGFSALGLLDSLIATVNGQGGALEQSNLYLDHLSAAAWCGLVQGRDYHSRFGVQFRECAAQIERLTRGGGLDVVALGCGDGRREVALVTALLQPGEPADLRLYLLDISQPLLSEAYTHAARTLDGYRGVSVTAVQGNFHDLPRYGQLLYRPEASHRRRVVTMLGGTMGNLDNELRWISDALSGFSGGDLFLCDLTRGYTDDIDRVAIERADPALRNGGLIPEGAAAEFFLGPLLRYQRGPRPHIELRHELGPACVVPASYQIDQVATVTRPGERSRRFVVGRSRRYNVGALGKALKALGWQMRSEVQPDPSGPISLVLFERQ